MPIPPVEVLFRTSGLPDVLAAFKSIKQAATEAARAQAMIGSGAAGSGRAAAQSSNQHRDAVRGVTEQMRAQETATRRAEKAQRDLERAAREAQKAASQGRDFFGNQISLSGQDRGLRQMSGSKAFEMIMGKTAAQLLGLHGPMGQVVGAFSVMRGAVAHVTNALTSFGSYVLTDIIKPQIKLSVSAAQIANLMGGANGKQVQGAINGLHETNANFDLATITSVFKTAAGKTKNFGQASEVARLALMAGKAYGADPDKLAEYVGDQRAKFKHFDDKSFANFIGQDLRTAKDAGGDLTAYLSSVHALRNVGNSFGGQSLEEQAGAQHYLGSLVAGASRDGKTGTIAANGLTQLLEDVRKRPEVFGMTHQQAATMNASTFGESFLPRLIARVGGNLRDPRYALGEAGGAAGTVPLNKTSVQFLQALGLDRVYNETKGTAAQKEQAVSDFIRNLTKSGDAAADLAQVQDDASGVEETDGYKIARAHAALEAALIPLTMVAVDRVIPALTALASILTADDVRAALTSLGQVVAKVALGILEVYNHLPGVTKASVGTMKSLQRMAGEDDNTTDGDASVVKSGGSFVKVTDIDRKLYRSSGSLVEDAGNTLIDNAGKILFGGAAGLMYALGNANDDTVARNKRQAEGAYDDKTRADITTGDGRADAELIKAAKALYGAAEKLGEPASKDPARSTGIGGRSQVVPTR